MEEPSVATRGSLAIDIGTHKVMIAELDGRHANVLYVESGKRSFPSFVLFDNEENEVLTGLDAKSYFRKPENVFYCSKMLCGADEKRVSRMKERIRFAFDVGDTSRIEESITHLVKDAYKHSKRNDKKVTIGAPLFYTQAEKEKLLSLVRSAGFEAQILPEEVAIGAAFVAETALDTTEPKSFAVVDFAAGHFSCAVLLARNVSNCCNIEVIAHGGTPYLGGKYIDDELINHLMKKHKNGIELTDKERRRVRFECERVKQGLMVARQARAHVDNLNDKGDELNVAVTKLELEQLISKQIETAVKMVAAVHQEARKVGLDATEIVMCGGSSRIPLFREKLKEQLANCKVNSRLNEDEIVVTGLVHLTDGTRFKWVEDTIKAPVNIPDNEAQSTQLTLIIPNEHSKELSPKYQLNTDDNEGHDDKKKLKLENGSDTAPNKPVDKIDTQSMPATAEKVDQKGQQDSSCDIELHRTAQYPDEIMKCEAQHGKKESRSVKPEQKATSIKPEVKKQTTTISPIPGHTNQRNNLSSYDSTQQRRTLQIDQNADTEGDVSKYQTLPTSEAAIFKSEKQETTTLKKKKKEAESTPSNSIATVPKSRPILPTSSSYGVRTNINMEHDTSTYSGNHQSRMHLDEKKRKIEDISAGSSSTSPQSKSLPSIPKNTFMDYNISAYSNHTPTRMHSDERNRIPEAISVRSPVSVPRSRSIPRSKSPSLSSFKPPTNTDMECHASSNSGHYKLFIHADETMGTFERGPSYATVSRGNVRPTREIFETKCSVPSTDRVINKQNSFGRTRDEIAKTGGQAGGIPKWKSTTLSNNRRAI